MVEIAEEIQSKFKVGDTDEATYDAVVNAPFATLIPAELDLGTIVLLVENETQGVIERVALSKTASAEGAVNASALPFRAIAIPRDCEESAHVQALATNDLVVVVDWYDLFVPALTPQQARDNQAGAGIACSIVAPYIGTRHRGTIIFSFYITPQELKDANYDFVRSYAAFVASQL